MDVKTLKSIQPSAAFPAHRASVLDVNPFVDAFSDPLCELNLKETSDFVKAFPSSTKKGGGSGGSAFLLTSAERRGEGACFMSQQKRLEQAPSTPGRPVFSFSVGNQKKGFPSKWDDAEKWLINSSCYESPAQIIKQPILSKVCRQNGVLQHKGIVFQENVRVPEDKVQDLVTSFSGSVYLNSANSAFHGSPSHMFLKDKFTDEGETMFPRSRYCEPSKEGFLFDHPLCQMPMKDASTQMVKTVGHRDVGTEMTPLGSSTTSRCHTPFKSSSPARHNTPTCVSGPLVVCSTSLDIAELQDLHRAKLEQGYQFDSVVSYWSSRQEEEEELSKSLRHFEVGGGRKSIGESAASAWEEEEKTKSCIRYQREEAKIQAWLNLQSAKAEAQSRKLEVKIQKMRSNLEEKLMRRMAIVHRRADEWRAAAELQHAQQIQRASQQAQKMRNQHDPFLEDTPCGCIPCKHIQELYSL